MSRGQNPLVLMMALSMPAAAHALGLGDIHVDTALNEPLAAEIDIVGATAAELADLRAAVADRETFLRYGVDRPAFLSSVTFKVSQDGQGRPLLALRSTDAFTEPLINFLVDLRWHKGELVREYTLLLDPAGFAANRASEAATAPAIVVVPEPATQATMRANGKVTRYKVGAKGTLRGIAWRAGARSESDLDVLMIAIFRNNPGAFEGNINRLRRGAVIDIPGAEALASISKPEANHEVRTQMAAWHAAGKSVAARNKIAAATAAEPDNTNSSSSNAAANSSAVAASAALSRQVQSMQQSVDAMKRELDGDRDRLLSMQKFALQQPVAGSAVPTPVAVPAMAKAVPSEHSAQASPVKSTSASFAAVIASLSLLGGALAAGLLAFLFFRSRRRTTPSRYARDHLEPIADFGTAGAAATNPNQVAAGIEATPSDKRNSVPAPIDPDKTARLQAIGTDDHKHELDDTASNTAVDLHAVTVNLPIDTINLPVDTANLRVDAEQLDYNLLDLDMTAQHVQMPSVLHEHVVVAERRTNIVDVLRTAIEREPDRKDLRLKLL
ncbi:MAG TPA: FimV/HubP family polar landmark protein, partial [Steroidobacteraceae bacterium]